MIMQFLRRQAGKNVALRDVPNLVSKLKEARRGQTKAVDRLELVLRNFCRAFPEVLMVDATHNTKNARHKQFRFLDSRRHRPHVQQHVESRARHYLIIVDDDFGAISLLQEAFPGARVLLCVFYVVKYLRGEAARRDYGVIDREKVEDAVYLMLNMQPEEEYDTGFKHLYYVVEGKQIPKDEDIPEPVHPFLRLVAAWGHRKDALKPTMAMDECVDTLVFLQSIAEME
ncbi:hypothetical protein PI126_g3643 [Phytophthora idaei]|nr:hypothetical protein PI126_g3643 [Phytophthora idaei]